MSHNGSFRAACAATILLLFAAVIAFGREPVALTVHVDRPGVKISPTLYGIFFEEINRAGDGGLYAEMLQNRSFEDDRGERDRSRPKSPVGALSRPPGPRRRSTSISSQPLNPQNPNSLRLEIANDSKLPVGVANEGFNGIALVKGAEYVLSFYARCSKGPATARSPNSGGQAILLPWITSMRNRPALEAVSLSAGGQETTTKGSPGAFTSSSGTLWLDQVSLFPKKTWKGRPNGLRPDLAEMLAAMKPSFIRFPGGCYVEGNRLHNAFRWKTASATWPSGPATGTCGDTVPPTAWATTSICNSVKTSARSRCSSSTAA